MIRPKLHLHLQNGSFFPVPWGFLSFEFWVESRQNICYLALVSLGLNFMRVSGLLNQIVGLGLTTWSIPSVASGSGLSQQVFPVYGGRWGNVDLETLWFLVILVTGQQPELEHVKDRPCLEVTSPNLHVIDNKKTKTLTDDILLLSWGIWGRISVSQTAFSDPSVVTGS